MRVVYVSSLPSGGPVTHLVDLAPRVAELGVSVKVICGHDSVAATFRDLGIEAQVRPLRHMIDLTGAKRIWPGLKAADVVHTHDRRTGLVARPLARLLGAASVHTAHGLPEGLESFVGRDHVRVPLGIAAARLRAEAALSRLGTVVAPSEAMARILVKNGFSSARVTVIHHGVARIRRSPLPAHDPIVVGTAANLERFKGVDTLIEACARLNGPLRLEVFGDGSLRSELERQAVEQGVDARFHGWVADLRTRLSEIDIFALPTRSDNLPLAVLEAMASALPVISTRVGGVPEVVADGVTGILVEPNDPDALATAIGSLIIDDERREALGRAGAQRIDEHFEAGQMARRTVDLYRQVLK